MEKIDEGRKREGGRIKIAIVKPPIMSRKRFEDSRSSVPFARGQIIREYV
jgi:hypothetical protein